MAYGNTSYLGMAAGTIDDWLDANGIDLFTSHNPLLALLESNSTQPGGDYQFMRAEGAKGDTFRVPVWGKPFNYSAGSTPARGVTRANQVNGFTPVIDDILTTARYPWAHYEGMVYVNYEDMVKNSGSSKKVDLADVVIGSLQASFFSEVAIDLEDGIVGSADKVQSINQNIANTGATVGGIDQTDGTNNAWWQAQTDSTVETWNTTTFDRVYDACCFDTGISTGIRKQAPDCAIVYDGSSGRLFSTMRQELKQSQRIDGGDNTLKGGGSYIIYNGCRIYRSTKAVAGSVCILNSSTWTWRYETKMPDPVAPTWVPVSGKPSMYERGYNWLVGFGCLSPKHNGYCTNKAA